MTSQSLYISVIFVILLSASIDASRHRSVRQKRANECPNPQGNACLFVTCQNGGICYEDPNNIYCFKCTCTAGYSGQVCDTAIGILPTGCTPGCQNGGLCNVNICVCPTGYTGSLCEIRNYCLPSNPCQNGGRCTSTNFNYVCDCTGTGYDGTTCTNLIPTNPCVSSPCQNGGQCTWDGTTVNCLCFNSYSGAYCQIPPVPCATTPCQNGGTCQLLATSIYGCVCPPEFTGTQCETSILATHPCVTMPLTVCRNGGVCTVNGPNYLCNCATGWSGTNCEIRDVINSCNPSPCGAYGSCLEATTATGIIAICNCVNPWTGKYCDVNMDGSCVGYCLSGGVCQMNGNVPYCQCPTFYTGARCETYVGGVTSPTTTLPVVTLCTTNPCLNGGTCYVYNTVFGCACLPNYTGPTCAIPDILVPTTTLSPVVSTCASNPCLNGGTCFNNGNSFVCACPLAWTGVICEYSQFVTSATPFPTPSPGITCLNQPCKNGGTCYSGTNTYYCQCPNIYTGTNCEIMTSFSCPLNCAPGICVSSGSAVTPYVCDCNGTLKLGSCNSK